MSEILAALKALLADVKTIEGYWTEGLDNSVRRAEAAIKNETPQQDDRFSTLLSAAKQTAERYDELAIEAEDDDTGEAAQMYQQQANEIWEAIQAFTPA